MKKIKKAFVWGRLAEYAFSIAEDERQSDKKRLKALELGKRFYRRAKDLIEDVGCNMINKEGSYNR